MFQVAVKQIVNNPYFVQKNDTLDFENFSNYLNKNFMLLTQHKFTNEEIRKMDKEELINYIFSI
ncbi:preprotein translocase subunit SecA [Mycoplasmopsis arginini]|nr:preprotein translocase subunit SecA [Chlamydia trachomatis]SGA03106.1 preprotein translocase subunit SecA [Chlamydia abortus]SGA08212.1 preprotein translocase subunit SecA [Mycoplasmopsis arginini]CRH46860.1 preprotein translocase subunit SecA [Chlamydia trachomatis]CRH55153.1 preprotein translocase subunit SecA [Chlamydia trachomatis]